jgi:uncharacterized protein (TIGR03067 family)
MIMMVAFAVIMGGGSQASEKKKAFKDIMISGELNENDLKDAQRNGPSKTHEVKLIAGKVYTIDMVSTAFDSYLRILDEKGNQLDEDDDSGGDLNARILFNCTKDGVYKIVCTTFDGMATGGAYTLTVKASGNAPPQPSSAQSKMIGAAAPDFIGDFAVNGEPVKLSSLQGKVVLVNFCDMRNAQSVAMLPRLAQWSKSYKDKGLEIVTITFYPSAIDQALEFDKETGTIKAAKRADRKSDRGLCKDFAAYHKIDHLLMMLPKQDALDVFNAYYVNGMPQVVLVDRKGNVRLIDVGGEKSTGTVETELKKVLADGAVPGKAKADLQKELKKFAGSWTFESVVAGGKQEANAAFMQMTMTFEGDKHTVKADDKVVQAGIMRLDPTTTPKSIDVTFTDGPQKGAVILGIYEISGDTLKVCFDLEGKTRPTEFSSMPGSQTFVAIHKRVKK